MSTQSHDLEATAAAIESNRPADVRMPLRSGLERPDSTQPVNPAQFMPKADPDAPRLLPASRGGGGGGGGGKYVTSAGISYLSDKVAEARRRDADAVLGETKAAAKSWADFVTAADQAKALVRDIPAAMSRANAARAEALADPGEHPVVLPSVADARAHAEALAGKALRHALELRRRYDAAVEESAGDRLAQLEKEVPTQAAEILARVADLKAAVLALRAGVTTLTHAAGEARGQRPRSLPTAVRLDLLDDLEKEVRTLTEVAADPSEPALAPSLRERAYIHQQAQMAVGGITAATVELARVEASESYRYTQYTRGIPQHVLDNAAEQAQYR